MISKSLNSADDFGPILSRIVKTKRQEVEEARARVSLSEIEKRAARSADALDFLEAVQNPDRMCLIAEIKKASPSKGIIRKDFDPCAIADSYLRGGADAVSVLTDHAFFQGSSEIFRSVRERLPLPMLRKEFMIDAYQFYEARAMGADAVLLITSILSDAQLVEFHDLAEHLGMTALVETHSEKDLRRVMELIKPRLLGINNRDLHDANFQTDLQHTIERLPMVQGLIAEEQSMPCIVSESGIDDAKDVCALRGVGVSCILVGESLMRQDDPERAVRELMR